MAGFRQTVTLASRGVETTENGRTQPARVASFRLFGVTTVYSRCQSVSSGDKLRSANATIPARSACTVRQLHSVLAYSCITTRGVRLQLPTTGACRRWVLSFTCFTMKSAMSARGMRGPAPLPTSPMLHSPSSVHWSASERAE